MVHFITKAFLLLIVFMQSVVLALAQGSAPSMGTPSIVNYIPTEYRAGTQTWSIALSEGYIFFGNNDGLLVFDGSRFSLHPLPNKTIVRSVKVINDRIYVGGQNEFGFFTLQQNGNLVYQSLSAKLPEPTQLRISDVWAIHAIDSQIIYQSDHHLIGFQGLELKTTIETDPIIIKSSSHKGRLLWYTSEQALYEWKNKSPRLLKKFSPSIGLTPSYIYPKSKDSIIISTLYKGFFLFNTDSLQPHFTFLTTKALPSVYTAKVNNGQWYIGTSRNGIFQLDMKGQIVEHYAVENGLQNNTVLSLAIDSFGNIWAGLDRGIDFIPCSSPFKMLYPDSKLRGTGYGAILFEGNYYFATNNGLYVTSYPASNPPRLVKGSEGQVWRVESLDNILYVNHHKGLFQLNGDSLELISPTSGSWLLCKVPGTDWVVEGTYEGLNVYHNDKEGLIYKRQIYGFEESSRYISIEGNRIWVAHPYKGLFKLSVDQNLQLDSLNVYRSEAGLDADLNILTFQLTNEVVFTGQRGIYQYIPDADTFVVHPDFAPFFDSTSSIKLLQEGALGNLWFVEGDRIGYLEVQETSLRKSITKHLLPAYPKSLTAGFEFILPSENMVVLAVEDGFVLVQRQRLKQLKNQRPTIRLNQLIASGRSDTVLQLGFGFHQQDVSIPADFPNIEVDFTLDNLALSGIVQFQYRLLGYDEAWSDWTTHSSLSYNYLQPGNYTLEVRARMMDIITDPKILTFTVNLPWFKRPAAIISFLVLVGIALLGIALIPSIRFRSAKRKLEYNKVKEIRAKEQQFQSKFAKTQEKIDQLKAEKMQVELNHQAKELAGATMQLVQKGEMLAKIKDNLTEVNKLVLDPKAKRQINSVIRTIESDVNFDENWKNFEHKFDKVHVNFTKRLKEQFPLLTPNDIKLCTYLKLNLTSKEIASLTNISVRGVEISRYRLRKKLDIESNVNLVEFVQSV